MLKIHQIIINAMLVIYVKDSLENSFEMFFNLLSV